MGKALIAVGQSDITITRSIVRDTVKQLIEQTGFDPEASLVFDDDTVDSPRNLKNIFDGCYNNEGLRTNYKSYVFIEYTDKTSEQGWLESMRQNHETFPLFNDKTSGIVVKPNYVQHENVITMRFRSNSRTQLSAWQNALRTSDAIKTHLGYIDVRYDYAFPEQYLAFIHETWLALEELNPGKQSLKDYLAENMRGDIQKRSNLSGKEKQVIAVERQMNVEGVAEDTMFWNEREIQRGIYEVVLTYNFRYRRITAVSMEYPAVVGNKFIKQEFVNMFHQPFRGRKDTDFVRPLTFIDGKIHAFEIDYYFMGDGGSRMVPWDDFFPSQAYRQNQTVSLFPITVDKSDATAMFNLKDLGEEFLPKGILDYMIYIREKINHHSLSLVNIELYSIGEEEKKVFTKVDEDLNVISNVPMESHERQYVRISLARDIPGSLHPSALEDLLNNAELALELFKIYDPTITMTNDPSEWEDKVGREMTPGYDRTIPSILLGTETKISDGSFTRWVRKLSDTGEWFVNLVPKRTKTVGQYNISTR